MSTTTSIQLAFRCNKCWQLTAADAEQSGKSVPCLCCSTPVIVPEPTPDRIKAGEEFASDAELANVSQLDLNENISDDQIRKIARDKVRADIKAGGDLTANAASRLKRFCGSMIDGFAGCVAAAIGFVLAVLVVMAGGEKEVDMANAVPVVILMGTLPLMLTICQLYMTAVDGRTIGKYCMKTKIVNQHGNPPGFIQGVVLRLGVNSLLYILPFYGMIDALWVFGDAKRCLHDIIAGTYVIDA